MTTQDEIKTIKEMLKTVFRKLKDNDSDLINLPADCHVLEHETQNEVLERKLHEVCINHRLALYIENFVKNNINDSYKVDIEYNRYYRNKKVVNIDGTDTVVRPDIIVHTRADRKDFKQHYLIIEAKKTSKSIEDEKVVKSFIYDDHYNYKFGLTVLYNNFDPIKVKLFYKKDGKIVHEELKY